MPKNEEWFELLSEVNLPGSDDSSRFSDPRRRDRIRDIIRRKTDFGEVAFDDFLTFACGTDDGESPAVLLSCHIDTVFSEEQLFLRREGGAVCGTLDNSVSVAVMLHAMMRGILPQNVYVTFTGDEEKEGNGARQTIRFLREEKPDVFRRLALAMDADVSAVNWEHDVSLEACHLGERRDLLGHFLCEDDFMAHLAQVLKGHFIDAGTISKEDAVPGESFIYGELGLNAVSLCIPVRVDCGPGDPCLPSLCYDKRVKEHCIRGLATTFEKMVSLERALGVVCRTIVSRNP